jgi:hypothetical protein
MAMTSSLTVLSELANGTAFFEYVETNDDDGFFNGPFASISSAFADRGKKKSLFFARIGASQGTVQARQGTSQAMKKVEHYTVRKVTGDGRCMFRALVCLSTFTPANVILSPLPSVLLCLHILVTVC